MVHKPSSRSRSNQEGNTTFLSLSFSPFSILKCWVLFSFSFCDEINFLIAYKLFIKVIIAFSLFLFTSFIFLPLFLFVLMFAIFSCKMQLYKPLNVREREREWNRGTESEAAFLPFTQKLFRQPQPIPENLWPYRTFSLFSFTHLHSTFGTPSTRYFFCFN